MGVWSNKKKNKCVEDEKMKRKNGKNEGNECGMEDARGEEVVVGNGWPTATSWLIFRRQWRCGR